MPRSLHRQITALAATLAVAIVVAACSGSGASTDTPLPHPANATLPQPTNTPLPQPAVISTSIIPTLTDEAEEGATCTLSGGGVVQTGWSGKDTGANYCNRCMCTDAGLACTKMACPPVELPSSSTTAPPTAKPTPGPDTPLPQPTNTPLPPSTYLELPVAKDTAIWESTDGSLSSGGGWLFVGQTGQGVLTRALVWFDLSTVPQNATIKSATLTLNVDRTQAGPVSIGAHRLLADWGEAASAGSLGGGGGGNSAIGDATWLHKSFGNELWSKPGGDFEPMASASRLVSNGPVSWTSESLIADVQAWVNKRTANFGWILVVEDESASRTSKRFTSKEKDGEPPTLIIEFTP